MNEKTRSMLEFNNIMEMLKEYALTEKAKERISKLEPVMNQKELEEKLRETTEARKLLDMAGQPPLMSVNQIEQLVLGAGKGELLSVDELEAIRQFCASCGRLKRFLNKSRELGLSIAVYGEGIDQLDELRLEIERCIRSGHVEEDASKELKSIRKKLTTAMNQIHQKLDSILKSKKQYFSESFVSNRNGHFTLPVKKEYKLQISGSVIDTSATGATYFIEPSSVAKLKEAYDYLVIEESNEERKILYTLSSLVADYQKEILLNLEYVETLDYMFAKGKLSADMNGIEAKVCRERRIAIKNGRHPLIPGNQCVPLNLSMGDEVSGIVITGPNTGGKTVALKTVGLFSLMVQCGLHIPCEEASFCMNSQVLCDIGDGQSITENLSTFSAHIRQVIQIIEQLDKDSLVLMDELGSGTDPLEGMGIAIAILEELRESGCMFIATTHYPEVKEYAAKTQGLLNARMAFDKESLRPLYRLELGEAGESCALYIARKLGMPMHMIRRASQEACKHEYKAEPAENCDFAEEEEYPVKMEAIEAEKQKEGGKHQAGAPFSGKQGGGKLTYIEEQKVTSSPITKFSIGDSVVVFPSKKLGIVFQTADANGMVGVQIQKKKVFVNHKRLQIKNLAKDLYPEDYDFSIIFESVENRKARKNMGKRHQEGLVVHVEQPGK